MKRELFRSQLPLLCTCVWIALLALLFTRIHSKNEIERAPLLQLKAGHQETLRAFQEKNKVLREYVQALADPAAGEKALIEELGVVPKGMIRVEYKAHDD